MCYFKSTSFISEARFWSDLLLLTIIQIKFPRCMLPISGLTRVEIFLRYLYGTYNFVMSGLIFICIFYRSHHQKLIVLWKRFSLTTGTAHLVKCHCSVLEAQASDLKEFFTSACPGFSTGNLKSRCIVLPHIDGPKDTEELSQARGAHRWAQASGHLPSHPTACWGVSSTAAPAPQLI